MIGNDVVDLILARKDSNWNRSGLVDKICTDSEKELIRQSENHEMMFWRLWSTKEAAYKIWNRMSKKRSFNPKYFECFVENKIIGTVQFGSEIVYSKTDYSSSSHLLHSIVVQNKQDFGKIDFLANRNHLKKIDGLPYHINTFGELNSSVSISNHGRFEKIVFLKS